MKVLKRLAAFLILGATALSIISCGGYERLWQVEREVDYSPAFVTDVGISYSYGEALYFDKACELVDYNEKSGGRVEDITYLDDSVIFTLRYDGYDGAKGSSESHDHTACYAAVAIFKIDVSTGACELLYDFGRVLPTYEYDHYTTEVYGLVALDKLAFTYNGKLELFDLGTKSVVQSFNVYDTAQYLCWEWDGLTDDVDRRKNFPFRLCGSDYYANHGTRVDYYAFNGTTYEKTTIESPEGTKVGEVTGVYENIFYSYDPESKTAGLCFDTSSLYVHTLNYDEVLEFEAMEKEQNVSDPDDPIVDENGARYTVAGAGDGAFKVLDGTGTVIKRIDLELLCENAAYKRLMRIFGKGVEATPYGYFIEDGRLYFLVADSYGVGRKTPTFVFEYDTPSQSIKYSGLFSPGASLKAAKMISNKT